MSALPLLRAPFESPAERATPAGRRAGDRLRMVLDVQKLFEQSWSEDQLLARVEEAASRLVGGRRARTFLTDGAEFVVRSRGGSRRFPCHAGLAGAAFLLKQPVEVVTPEAHPAYDAGADRWDGGPVSTTLLAPLIDLDRRTVGVLEVADKDGRFTAEDRTLLALLADQAAVAIQRNRLRREAMEAVELRREMELARRVQVALSPLVPPRLSGYEMASFSRTASVTGGDAHDLWRIADGRLAVFVGDASGHGLAAALVIAQVRTLLRTLVDIRPDPAWVLARVNGRLAEDLDDGRFATAFLGILSPGGRLDWSSAGQAPLFLRPRGGADFVALSASTEPLGVLPELIPEPAPPMVLEPGGCLVLPTDGITEAGAGGGELFGVERLGALLATSNDTDPARLVERVRVALDLWEGGSGPADDQTLVVVARNPA